jgi:hypothetical protein
LVPPKVLRALPVIETYVSITTCPPASCISAFAELTREGGYTLNVPNFQQCVLDQEPCNAPITTYNGVVFDHVDIYYGPESTENPQCTFAHCTYNTTDGDILVISTPYTDSVSRATAYLPAVMRTFSWKLGFLHDTCTNVGQALECDCPFYRFHGVQTAWDNQGCCCDGNVDPTCNVIYGPVPKYSSLCTTTEQCRQYLPVPSPSPVPDIPCPPPPSVLKKLTTCPPSSLIQYGNDGWFINGDTSIAYECDTDHSNGCIVDGVFLQSGVRFSQLEVILDDDEVEYMACTYSVNVKRSDGKYYIDFVTMNLRDTSVYSVIDAVMYSPGGNPSVLICDVTMDEYVFDVCSCPFHRNKYVPSEPWEDCCCDGISSASCYLLGVPCPSHQTPTSSSGEIRISYYQLGGALLYYALAMLIL